MKVPLPQEYISGFSQFLNCRIDLSKKAFIPRMETEYWTAKAIKEIQKKFKKPFHALDMFAGSGCIGIAIAKSFPRLCERIDFADSSKKALSQIRINLKINEIPEKKYRVISSNLFEDIKVTERYELILANPPYVAEERIKEVEKSALKYEPREALFSGKKGIKHITRFLEEARKFLNGNGLIFLEFDPLQKRYIENIIRKKYSSFKFYKDQFGKYRWAKIIK